ncbi:MAG: hypothetical protein S4CHLAM20_07410 [Chlamydiia bacterium]|nr:hypothetical protein [Chlamydiia bacterium]
MKGYLICEDGPLTEWVFTFDDGDSWLIGRDSDVCRFVIEDPMVSRKHLLVSLEEGAFYIQNESSTNPALLNDQPIEEKSKVEEDDLIQIGNNVFRFTTQNPENKIIEDTPQAVEEPKEEPLTLGSFDSSEETNAQWMIKVITGPASGSIFFLKPSTSYVIGSESNSSDIILHDLSISKNHARISLSEDNKAAIIDLQSRNGVYVNGQKIDHDTNLTSKDLITLGTTSILFINVDQTRETIYSPGNLQGDIQDGSLFAEDKEDIEETPKNWKDTFIPTKHLAIASIFSVFICVGILSMLALFRSTKVKNPIVDETKAITSATSHFQDIEFNYNPNTSTLFLTGHVLTELEYSELLYRLKNVPFISSVDDNVIIDESVYDNINAMLLKNPAWRSVLMTAKKPGHFVLTGYIKSEAEKTALTDFLNKYFQYLNLLENQVVVEETLNTQIENLLVEHGFANVLFQQNNGRLVLSGRAHEDHKRQLDMVASDIERIHGVRTLKNFVIFTTKSTVAIDLTSKYKVNGSSKHGDKNQFVLINGKILGVNDTLDGMTINHILNKEIFLNKDGVKYKIDFNE